MNGVGFKILARTPIPQLSPTYPRARVPLTYESRKIGSVIYFFVENRGLIMYLAALKKGGHLVPPPSRQYTHTHTHTHARARMQVEEQSRDYQCMAIT